MHKFLRRQQEMLEAKIVVRDVHASVACHGMAMASWTLPEVTLRALVKASPVPEEIQGERG